MLIYLLFILGFPLLIKGADLLVEGASSIAKKYKVSDMVIGLTIVAFGTSAPEFVVNVFASSRGQSELAITNVLGSNIANIFLALGMAAIIAPLVVKKNTVSKEIPLGFLGAVVVGILANDVLIDHALTSSLTRIDGLILICFFTVFFSYTITMAQIKHELPDEKVKIFSAPLSIFYILLGLGGLILGGNWIVDGAVRIATQLGFSQALIGLTVVAVGTSLPEIATSAVSAYKGKNDIAIGNVIGSNIFNIFFVLGISATIKPLPFDTKINSDILANIIASGLLFLFLYIANKKKILNRVHGIFFILLYVAYLTYSILRG